MLMYCVKCKSKTETFDQIATISRNKKFMIKGFCDFCHGPKQQFVKSSDVEGMEIKELYK